MFCKLCIDNSDVFESSHLQTWGTKNGNILYYMTLMMCLFPIFSSICCFEYGLFCEFLCNISIIRPTIKIEAIRILQAFSDPAPTGFLQGEAKGKDILMVMNYIKTNKEEEAQS